jgi:hypothetical protein
VPAEHHGRLVVMAMLVYAGDPEAGRRAVAPLRALATPIADLVRPMSYPEIYPPDDGGFHPTAVTRTMFVDQVDRQVAATILEYLQSSDAPMRAAQLRVLGGAMARVPADATAFAHRASRIMVNLAAIYQGPADRAVREAWVADFAAALRQGDGGAYANFLGDEGRARVRQAYPGSTWERLVAIKARYDPHQPVPAQPEHPASDQGVPGGSRRTPSGRRVQGRRRVSWQQSACTRLAPNRCNSVLERPYSDFADRP